MVIIASRSRHNGPLPLLELLSHSIGHAMYNDFFIYDK